ncbi:MAG: transglutaminase family protein [Leptospirales bacterium]|nr:transglutaminase family protein [Leptospirales bacterium]
MSREIENLLLSLYDCKDEKESTYLTRSLFRAIPLGHHPMLYVERVKNPAVRWGLRHVLFPSLSDLKIRHDLKELLNRSKDDGEIDLEMGAFLIARAAEESDVVPEDLTQRLDSLAKPLAFALKYAAGNPEARMQIFRYYMFDKLGFRGNAADYYDPDNSFITSLLRTGKGIPVTISVLCILLARRVGLPVYGVNMPGHFLLTFREGGQSWFMDPFDQGAILSEEACLQFLSRQNLPSDSVYLKAAENITILKRMYRNLIHIHSSRGNREQERALRRHLFILENAGAAP